MAIGKGLEYIVKKIYICVIGIAVFFTACAKNNEEPVEFSETLGLNWYSEKDDVKQEMKEYTLISESEETGAAGEMQTLLEYSGVSLYEQSCDVTLCFTSIGLIGINYHDTNKQYDQWVERITASYGEPTEVSDFGIASWENNPIGVGTSIYVFMMEECVQISFFTDEAGSETAAQ